MDEVLVDKRERRQQITVGELLEALAEMPDEMLIDAAFEDGYAGDIQAVMVEDDRLRLWVA